MLVGGSAIVVGSYPPHDPDDSSLERGARRSGNRSPYYEADGHPHQEAPDSHNCVAAETDDRRKIWNHSRLAHGIRTSVVVEDPGDNEGGFHPGDGNCSLHSGDGRNRRCHSRQTADFSGEGPRFATCLVLVVVVIFVSGGARGWREIKNSRLRGRL